MCEFFHAGHISGYHHHDSCSVLTTTSTAAALTPAAIEHCDSLADISRLNISSLPHGHVCFYLNTFNETKARPGSSTGLIRSAHCSSKNLLFIFYPVILLLLFRANSSLSSIYFHYHESDDCVHDEKSLKVLKSPS